ncbi:hypothetical protein F5883DRAFT_637273 [Diaporthe sp. PMI_573]|nr:hypothetical protein F5883DRAFT_637273 [Diaporthaceae sp. PMI_573]
MAPLPARKQRWEAGDESAWRTESHRALPGTEDSFGLPADGGIVRLDEGRFSCDDAWMSRSRASDAGTDPSCCAASWEEWCLGADGFGGLIILAASLVGPVMINQSCEKP